MQNTKTRREAAFLVTIVFALGVLLGGLGTHLWGERVWGHQTAPKSRDEIVVPPHPRSRPHPGPAEASNRDR